MDEHNKPKSSRRQILKTGAFAATGLAAVGPFAALAGAQGAQTSNEVTVATIAQQNPVAMPVAMINSAMSMLVDGQALTGSQAAAGFAQFDAATLLAKSATIQQNVDVDQLTALSDGTTIPTYNWTTVSWPDFVAEEYSIVPIVQSINVLEVDVVAMMTPLGQGAVLAVSKMFAALGLKDIAKSVLKLLNDLAKGLMKQLGDAIARGAWSEVKSLLQQLLEVITSPEFKALLGRVIGVEAAESAIASILADALPIVGWGIVVGRFVIAVAGQYVALLTETLPEPGAV